jgi:hypothetical protein
MTQLVYLSDNAYNPNVDLDELDNDLVYQLWQGLNVPKRDHVLEIIVA